MRPGKEPLTVLVEILERSLIPDPAQRDVLTRLKSFEYERTRLQAAGIQAIEHGLLFGLHRGGVENIKLKISTDIRLPPHAEPPPCEKCGLGSICFSQSL
jgi:hypothetical protein